MFKTLTTLSKAFSFNAEQSLKDHYSMQMINQKIRESESNLKLAKTTLAALIMRKRNEDKAIDRLSVQIKDLEGRAKGALEANNSKAANLAAGAIADLENENVIRVKTQTTLDERICNIRASIEKAHHRLTSLKQGAIAARAVEQETAAQKRVANSIGSTTSFKEAEEMIGRVLGQEDPFQQSDILEEIEQDLNHGNVADTLAAQGFGHSTKTSPEDVLARLKSKSKK